MCWSVSWNYVLFVIFLKKCVESRVLVIWPPYNCLHGFTGSTISRGLGACGLFWLLPTDIISVILADRSNLVLDFCRQASFLRSYFHFVISATRLPSVHVLNEWYCVMFLDKIQIQIIFLIFYKFFRWAKFRALFSRRPFWLFLQKLKFWKKGSLCVNSDLGIYQPSLSPTFSF